MENGDTENCGVGIPVSDIFDIVDGNFDFPVCSGGFINDGFAGEILTWEDLRRGTYYIPVHSGRVCSRTGIDCEIDGIPPPADVLFRQHRAPLQASSAIGR